MFKKKNVQVSTSDALKKDANKFQEAVTKLTKQFDHQLLDLATVSGVAAEFGVEVGVLASSVHVYLLNNAKREMDAIKLTGDYTIVHLENAAEKYGFDLNDII